MVHVSTASARLRKAAGITPSQVVIEATSKITRDASAIVIVSKINLETAVGFGGLTRQGYSVEVIVNCYSRQAFAIVSGPLLAEGTTALHSKYEGEIAAIWKKQLLKLSTLAYLRLQEITLIISVRTVTRCWLKRVDSFQGFL